MMWMARWLGMVRPRVSHDVDGQMVRYGAAESTHMMLRARWLGMVMLRVPT